MAEWMTGRERTETVLAGGIPDRVPVDLHDFMVAAYGAVEPFPEVPPGRGGDGGGASRRMAGVRA